jgi:hypothetical protein
LKAQITKSAVKALCKASTNTIALAFQRNFIRRALHDAAAEGYFIGVLELTPYGNAASNGRESDAGWA